MKPCQDQSNKTPIIIKPNRFLFPIQKPQQRRCNSKWTLLFGNSAPRPHLFNHDWSDRKWPQPKQLSSCSRNTRRTKQFDPVADDSNRNPLFFFNGRSCLEFYSPSTGAFWANSCLGSASEIAAFLLNNLREEAEKFTLVTMIPEDFFRFESVIMKDHAFVVSKTIGSWISLAELDSGSPLPRRFNSDITNARRLLTMVKGNRLSSEEGNALDMRKIFNLYPRDSPEILLSTPCERLTPCEQLMACFHISSSSAGDREIALFTPHDKKYWSSTVDQRRPEQTVRTLFLHLKSKQTKSRKWLLVAENSHEMISFFMKVCFGFRRLEELLLETFVGYFGERVDFRPPKDCWEGARRVFQAFNNDGSFVRLRSRNAYEKAELVHEDCYSVFADESIENDRERELVNSIRATVKDWKVKSGRSVKFQWSNIHKNVGKIVTEEVAVNFNNNGTTILLTVEGKIFYGDRLAVGKVIDESQSDEEEERNELILAAEQIKATEIPEDVTKKIDDFPCVKILNPSMRRILETYVQYRTLREEPICWNFVEDFVLDVGGLVDELESVERTVDKFVLKRGKTLDESVLKELLVEQYAVSSVLNKENVDLLVKLIFVILVAPPTRPPQPQPQPQPVVIVSETPKHTTMPKVEIAEILSPSTSPEIASPEMKKSESVDSNNVKEEVRLEKNFSGNQTNSSNIEELDNASLVDEIEESKSDNNDKDNLEINGSKVDENDLKHGSAETDKDIISKKNLSETSKRKISSNDSSRKATKVDTSKIKMRSLCPSIFSAQQHSDNVGLMGNASCTLAHEWDKSLIPLPFCWAFARKLLLCACCPCPLPHINSRTLSRIHQEFVDKYNSCGGRIIDPTKCVHWQFQPTLCQYHLSRQCVAGSFDYCQYGTHRLPPNFNIDLFCGSTICNNDCPKEHVKFHELNVIYVWKVKELKMFCSYC